jgi:hypothetical protein
MVDWDFWGGGWRCLGLAILALRRRCCLCLDFLFSYNTNTTIRVSIQCQMTQGKCYTDFHCSRNAYLNTDIESRVSDKVFRANRQKGGRDCNVSDTSHISLTKVRVSFFKRGRLWSKIGRGVLYGPNSGVGVVSYLTP